MRTTTRLMSLMLLGATLGAGLAACEREGPMERTGEEIDEAVDTMKNGGESLGSKVDDAMDSAADHAKEAGQAVEQKVDQAAAAIEESGEGK